ncbi:hypothetical protein HanHA89_Chr09g0358351 [Helianthus annuus]|nr:hypothetical protein HanHA89_Chr09g0358351 [Helianthus annuus]
MFFMTTSYYRLSFGKHPFCPFPSGIIFPNVFSSSTTRSFNFRDSKQDNVRAASVAIDLLKNVQARQRF